jgi:hypothetical protein
MSAMWLRVYGFAGDSPEGVLTAQKYIELGEMINE